MVEWRLVSGSKKQTTYNKKSKEGSVFNLNCGWSWVKFCFIELSCYSKLQLSCRFSYSIQISKKSLVRMLQTVVYKKYRKNVISQILSATIDYLIIKYRKILIWIKCIKSRVFLCRMIWKFRSICRNRRRDWSSVSSRVSIFLEWIFSEGCVNTRDGRSENGLSEKEEKKFLKWMIEIERDDVIM